MAAGYWSGTVTASYMASGKSDTAQSTQQLDMQTTFKDEVTVSGAITIQYAYTWANSCGPNSIKGSGSMPYTSRPSAYAKTSSTYEIAVPLGLYGASETRSELDTFNKCAKTDSANKTGGYSLGVAVVGGAADLTTATSISGTQTFTKGAGCAIGLPEFGHAGWDTCTLTITWNMTKPTCDPDLLEKANREYEIAAQLSEAGLKELEQAGEVLREVTGGEAKGAAADYIVAKVLEKALKAGVKKLGHVVVESGEGVILVIEFGRLFQEIAEGTHAWAAFSELQNAALKSFQSADAEAKKAKADLDKALAQGPCVGPARDELNKLLKHDADEAAIAKQVDEWQAPGSNDRYFVKGELADHGAAVKAAREIVLGKRSLQSVGFPTAQSAPRTYARHQIEMALADMKRAIASRGKVAARLKIIRARDKTLHDRIAALIR